MKMNYSEPNLLKKLVAVLFIMFLSFNFGAFAQEGTEAETEVVKSDSTSKGAFWDKLLWGPKAGVTISNFYDDKEDMSNAAPGFTVGASFSYPYMDWLEFGFEVLYAHQGIRNVDPRFLYSGMYTKLTGYSLKNTDVVLHTLEVPIMFTVFLPFGKDPNVKPMLTIGNSFGLNLYAETKNEFLKDNTAEFHATENVTERFQAQNFAITGGLGVQFKNKVFPIWYTAEVRYRLGYSDMGNVTTQMRTDLGAFDDYNNNMLQFTLGIKF
jgi:hypothetical protein